MSLRQNGCLRALNIQCSKPNTVRPITNHTMVKTSVGIIMTAIYEGRSVMTIGPCIESERITGECNRRFRREAQSKALFGSGSSDTSRGPLQQGGSLRPRNLRLGSLASTASACQPYLG